MSEELSFTDFRAQWLEDIESGSPSTVEVGNRFSRKLITQWLDISEDSEDIIYCDGSGDGGIDIAFLQHDEVDGNGAIGYTWYLVQSKYNSSFQGTDTIFIEGRKVIDTLSGFHPNLSSIAADLVDRLRTFLSRSSEHDRIVLVYGSIEPLSEDEERAMNDVRILGQQRLGSRFEVVSVTVNTIYEKVIDTLGIDQRIQIPIHAHLNDTESGLLVGTIGLVDLYQFLKQYQHANRGDLDMIYEKNVRRFLGGRGRIRFVKGQTGKKERKEDRVRIRQISPKISGSRCANHLPDPEQNGKGQKRLGFGLHAAGMSTEMALFIIS